MSRSLALRTQAALKVRDFDNLAIDGASAIAVLVEKHAKAVLRLRMVDPGGEFASICELQFGGVVDVVLDVVAIPLLGKVTNHRSVPADDVHARARHPLAMWQGPLTRYSINTDCARIEVVAEHHSFATIGRIAIIS